MDCLESRPIQDLANNSQIDLSDEKFSEFAVHHKGISQNFQQVLMYKII